MLKFVIVPIAGELRQIRLRLAMMALDLKDAASALTHTEAILYALLSMRRPTGSGCGH